MSTTKPYKNQEWLYDQYVVQGKTLQQISKEHGFDTGTLMTWMDKFGIERSSMKRGVKNEHYREKEWLYEQYTINQRSMENIADECGVTFPTIVHWMDKFGIDRRSRKSGKQEDREWLYQQYVVERRGLVEIANECGIARSVLTNRMKEFGIDRRNSGPLLDINVNEVLSDRSRLDALYKESNNAQIVANELGVSAKCVQDYMHRHNIEFNFNTTVSLLEQQLSDALMSFGIHVEQSNRSLIYPKEVDIYLPEHKVAVEVDGLYWHSDTIKNDKFNLYNKRDLFERTAPDHKLLQVFEDELLHNFDLVVRKILHIAGASSEEVIYARNTTIGNIGNAERTRFLNRNHIQGDMGCSTAIGLFTDDTLVAVMTFRKHGMNFELSRYATSCRVTGGFQKLLAYATTVLGITNIITFADRRWGNGTVYQKSGFERLYATSPNYFYFCKKKRLSRQRFQKHKLSNVLEHFDPSLTEYQNMRNNGYHRIFDCGHVKYSL